MLSAYPTVNSFGATIIHVPAQLLFVQNLAPRVIVDPTIKNVKPGDIFWQNKVTGKPCLVGQCDRLKATEKELLTQGSHPRPQPQATELLKGLKAHFGLAFKDSDLNLPEPVKKLLSTIWISPFLQGRYDLNHTIVFGENLGKPNRATLVEFNLLRDKPDWLHPHQLNSTE